MKLRRVIGFAAIAACCLFANGCFSIEQEIFLNADGSGELVIFISLPDLPEKMNAAADAGPKKKPAEQLADFKKDLTAALPPTITLKEAKEVKQNGVQSLYAVFHFKQLDDIKRVLANLGNGSLKEGEIGSDPEWSLEILKKGNKSYYTQKFAIDVEAKATAALKGEAKKDGKPEQSAEAAKASNDMAEQLKPLILSIIRMRFVLHAPSPITDTNADIVLNERTAVWNCSLVAFLKNKKPIELKASF